MSPPRSDAWPWALVLAGVAVFSFALWQDDFGRGAVPAGVCVSEQARAFDFLLHPMSVTTFEPSSDGWREDPAMSVGKRLAGGCVILDRFTGRANGQRIDGVSVMAFDAGTESWRIFWFDNRASVVTTPFVGRFEGNVGVFRAAGRRGSDSRDTVIWDRNSTTTARRLELTSDDGGATWRSNNIQTFLRTSSPISEPQIRP